MIYNFNLMN